MQAGKVSQLMSGSNGLNIVCRTTAGNKRGAVSGRCATGSVRKARAAGSDIFAASEGAQYLDVLPGNGAESDHTNLASNAAGSDRKNHDVRWSGLYTVKGT